MIAVIDYDMGNLRSVQKALQKAGADAEITRDPARIAGAEGVVLPGVGAFPLCMENLRKYGLVNPIKDYVDTGRPFLGICLGLQLLFEESEEFGSSEGLGILKGKVLRFPEGELKVPHIGWNTVGVKKPDGILRGVREGEFFYFVHSYYVAPEEDIAATETEYGVKFVSGVEKENVFAFQFHPEKSQSAGLALLSNFVGRVRDGG